MANEFRAPWGMRVQGRYFWLGACSEIIDRVVLWLQKNVLCLQSGGPRFFPASFIRTLIKER